ncbi:hypothetical protein EJB05_11245, partial [Eragrostis curvula]
MLASSQMLSLVLLLASSPAILAAAGGGDDDQGLIHIRLYVHETLAGPNATVTPFSASSFGANSSFGGYGVVDDELRVSRDRSSQLLGRFQVRRQHVLSVEGPLLGSKRVNERPVVGGTGKFRLARGYSLTETLGKTSPKTDVFLFDVFVLMHNGKH